MKYTCPICHEQYSSNGGGHCMGGKWGGCCQTFANDATGDAHRVGEFGPQRRCLTTEEMLAGDWPERKSKKPPVPWRLTPRGWTKHLPMPARVLESRLQSNDGQTRSTDEPR